MDKFNKTDDLYDPNFSIDSDSTEKLDMYGVWLKKKKDSIEPLDSDDSQIASDSGIEDQNDINFDDDFSFSNSDMDTDIKAPELEDWKISAKCHLTILKMPLHPILPARTVTLNRLMILTISLKAIPQKSKIANKKKNPS